jgi:hypothetical protein
MNACQRSTFSIAGFIHCAVRRTLSRKVNAGQLKWEGSFVLLALTFKVIIFYRPPDNEMYPGDDNVVSGTENADYNTSYRYKDCNKRKICRNGNLIDDSIFGRAV